MDDQFEAELALGASQALVGWNFSWLNTRIEEESLPWDYRRRVLERLNAGWQSRSGRKEHTRALLDIGTGGGEFLAGLLRDTPITPTQIWATEGYPPDVPLARKRLESTGVTVVDVSEAGAGYRGLPDETFDLIIDRHEGIAAAELARLLRKGGRYVTQQVGGQNCIDINRALQGEVSYPYEDVTLVAMVRELEQAGFAILDQQEAFPALRFLDLAGLVFYLQAISWQVPGFTVDGYRDQLREIYRQMEREGGWTVREHRFFVEAEA